VQIQTLATETRILNEKLNDAVEELRKGGIIDADTAAKIDKVNNDIGAVATAISEADYASTDDVGDLFVAAKEGVKASEPFNPYSKSILAVLGIAELVTLEVLRRKNRRLTKTNEGIQKFEGMSEPDIAGRLHDAIKGKIANT